MSILTTLNVFSHSRYDSAFSRVAWCLVGVVGAFVSIWLIQRAVLDRKRTKPLLTIDADGIEWDGIGDVGRITWSAVQSTCIRKHAVGLNKLRYLVIEIKNPTDIITRTQKIQKQKRMRQTLSFLGSPAIVPENILDTCLEDIQLEIENRLYDRREALGEHPSWRESDVADTEPLHVGNR